MHDRFVLPVGAAAQDSVVLGAGHIDAAVGIGLQAVGHAALIALVHHRRRHLLVAHTSVGQRVGTDAVEPSASQGK